MFDDVWSWCSILGECLLVPYLCCMPNLHQQVHEAVQSTEGQCLNACLWLLLKKRILNCKSASYSRRLLWVSIVQPNNLVKHGQHVWVTCQCRGSVGRAGGRGAVSVWLRQRFCWPALDFWVCTLLPWHWPAAALSWSLVPAPATPRPSEQVICRGYKCSDNLPVSVWTLQNLWLLIVMLLWRLK